MRATRHLAFWRELSGPVQLSTVLQLASLPLLLVSDAWPWVAGWLLLHHSVLNVAGTIPRSQLLGPNRTHIQSAGRVALTFDDGPDPDVTPAVLEILARRNVRATFFVIGERARQHPDLIQRIVREGHTIENHTQRHSSWFCTYSPAKLRRECQTAQSSIAEAGAPLPTYFRAPAGVRSAWLQPVLKELGLQLASWTRRGFDTSQSDSSRVLRRLTKGVGAGEILLLHDGNSARTAGGQPVVLAVLEPLLNELERQKLRPCPLTGAEAESTSD